jgi:hypothetical protein
MALSVMFKTMTKAAKLNSVCNSAYFEHDNTLDLVIDSVEITTTSPLLEFA